MLECTRADEMQRDSDDTGEVLTIDATADGNGVDNASAAAATRLPSSRPALPTLLDYTQQARYYDSNATKRIRDLIDVAVVWPSKRRFGSMPDSNRPPTRFHYWLALGIPVIGYPMNSYVEAARRLNYPVELVSLRTEEQLLSGFCALASAERRACLQQTVIPTAAQLSSPLNSALQLLAISCKVASHRGGLANLGDTNTEPRVQRVAEVLRGSQLPADILSAAGLR